MDHFYYPSFSLPSTPPPKKMICPSPSNFYHKEREHAILSSPNMYFLFAHRQGDNVLIRKWHRMFSVHVFCYAFTVCRPSFPVKIAAGPTHLHLSNWLTAGGSRRIEFFSEILRWISLFTVTSYMQTHLQMELECLCVNAEPEMTRRQ